MNSLRFSLLAIAVVSLTACVQVPPRPDDPAYAPVLPRTPMPQELNNGAIYQPGFEMTLYDDRKAHRVGDIITITLTERTAARKSAESEMSKSSSVELANPTLLGNVVGAKGLDLGVNISGSRSANGESEANQSNSLTGSITVTVAEVLPNGILAVRGEKWITLNTGDELVRISGLVRSDDIGQDNTVLSTRVADARITYSGTGAFANSSQPGWLSQFFLSPLWPF
ncbi:flagellar L-ring protein precursor FlgH [Halopseudomonas xinjiangensis]|uniref:Flagellar L-ring protein n=1 Tax=Halopseudomonas xinjiangensis TaxID=487184 RepID=A0A1H1U4H0_9GAMM|nr:flagellar basal body L-ring protein FlgH [Halopseudomonas xinjiangensis]SDS67166.1 flagellar L-ring protein precursor FlgH [Halopseudomonas xinjiangensis]